MDWTVLFDNVGFKTVTQNDRKKNAYVPNGGQRRAIEAAGFLPASDSLEPQLFQISVLLDESITSVTASYYLSTRSIPAQRVPEARMGRQLISEWLREGDQLLLGNIGNRLYALKMNGLPDEWSVTQELASTLPPDVILSRAAMASGPARRWTTTRSQFVRNPYVVAAALLRADGRCEVPGCTHPLFLRNNGKPYLEVHHLVPLGEGGADTLLNVAAICPSCHREMHHGAHGGTRTAAVAAHVASLHAGGWQP